MCDKHTNKSGVGFFPLVFCFFACIFIPYPHTHPRFGSRINKEVSEKYMAIKWNIAQYHQNQCWCTFLCTCINNTL